MKTILKTLLFTLVLFPLLSQATLVSKEHSAVENAYYQWCSAISEAKGNGAEITKFYAPKALLLPTLTGKILRNEKGGGMEQYFDNLTNLKNIKCTPEKLITTFHGETAINSGLYEFSFEDEKQHKKSVPARFTFVYQKFDGNWLIIKHHSSKLPEEKPTKKDENKAKSQL